MIIVALYVDDMLITSNNATDVKHLVKTLKKNFQIRDLGPSKHCIGQEVEITDNSISISQTAYALNLIQKRNQENSKLMQMPMQFKFCLGKDPKIAGEAEMIDTKKY